MSKTPETSLKITISCNELLDRIKADTGASKKWIVENAIKDKYPDYVEEKGEK